MSKGRENERRVPKLRLAPAREAELASQKTKVLHDSGYCAGNGCLADAGDAMEPEESWRCEVRVSNPVSNDAEDGASGPFETCRGLVRSFTVEACVFGPRKIFEVLVGENDFDFS